MEVGESVVRGLFGSEGLKARKIELKLVKDVAVASKAQASKRKEQPAVRQPGAAQRQPVAATAAVGVSGKPASVAAIPASQPRAQPSAQQRQPSKQPPASAASAAPVAVTAVSPPIATAASVVAAPAPVAAAITNTDTGRPAAITPIKNVWKLRQEQKASEQQPSPTTAAASTGLVGSPPTTAVTPPVGSPLATAMSGSGVIINPTITIIPSSLQGSSWQSSAQRAAAVSGSAPPAASAPAFSPGQSWSAVAGSRVIGATEAVGAPASPPLTTVRTLSPIVPLAAAVSASALSPLSDFDIGQPAPAWLPPTAHQPPPQLIVDDMTHPQQHQPQWMDEHHQQQLMHGGHAAHASHSHPSSPLSSRSYESAFDSASLDRLPISAADAYMRTPPISPLRGVGSLSSSGPFAPQLPIASSVHATAAHAQPHS